MKVILLPVGLNDSVCEAMMYDSCVQLIMPMKPEMIFLVCQDGLLEGYRTPVDDLQEIIYMKKFYAHLGVDHRIVFKAFSFYEDSFDAYDKLKEADLFYFKGFGGGFESVMDVFSSTRHWTLVEKLQELVAYNRMVYIGVCGGAMIAGKKWLGDRRVEPNLELLSLFGQASVRYDMCCPPEDVDQDIFHDLNIFHLTSACGIAIYCVNGYASGSCFIVKKTGRAKWSSFRQLNHAKVGQQARTLLKRWKAFRGSSNLIWWFCLDGRWHYEYSVKHYWCSEHSRYFWNDDVSKDPFWCIGKYSPVLGY